MEQLASVPDLLRPLFLHFRQGGAALSALHHAALPKLLKLCHKCRRYDKEKYISRWKARKVSIRG